MPRINLLPWREDQRKERQQNFLVAGAGAVLIGIVTIMVVSWTFDRFIRYQNQRNGILDHEIELLDEKIDEIKGLESQKERLLARMEIIERLQKSRPEVVHLFDELVRTLPDGVYLTSLKQSNRRLEIKGVAESTTRVSAYMRNIDVSEWLENPGLQVIETVVVGPKKKAEFGLTAQQVSTEEKDDGLREAGSL
ncbi:MAG: PilN domain-containing protein [Gammaproteobacteria bacterium]|nr:PilN domain-containing protein [Gammaproteobacteria bacterium]MCZ6686272.1 PilN domain-containing protein [Gammaproteobacteria bacterium]MCZ6762075.1 PilN domain-containing protein [Gammaproteobacteria bacterium]MCZ6880240.1 PilN domain-containing protein [Gammaproteobacteria bacterium]TDJ13399.1 MAG: pilus assembly protein PilN [Gammaproteobacteria bacterium]